MFLTSTLLRTNISPPKGTFEDDPSPKVGYASSLEGILMWFSPSFVVLLDYPFLPDGQIQGAAGNDRTMAVIKCMQFHVPHD